MAFKKLKLWFDKELGNMLANKLIAEYPSFDKKLFVKNIHKGVTPLELKDRVAFISDELHERFDCNYTLGLSYLLEILGPENENETGMFTEFYWVMPIAKYVEKYGLDNYKESIRAIEEITKRNTGEYAIRPYLEKYQEKTLKQMMKWSKSKNNHVRRLSSEGVRPRLPWAPKLPAFIENPDPIIPILNNLKDDPSKYVQKSVANCINDIIKDNLDKGKQLISEWNKKDISTHRGWIIKHALRNLLKANDNWAISIIR
jgi:3-methyladenine DNA glycosylase AlkC